MMMAIRSSWPGLSACAALLLLANTVHGQAAFDPLFRLANLKGVCLVKPPEAAAFTPAVNRRAYPYGTAVQLGQASEAVVLLSSENTLLINGPSEFVVDVQTNNPAGRVIRLSSGEARTYTEESLPETAVMVETPVATCDAFTGRATIRLSRDVDASIIAQVDAAAGGTRITGPQFTIPKLKSSCGVLIRSTPDRSLTRLINMVGEYPILLDNGTDTPVQFDSTTKSSVKIWRELAPVGGRLIVSVFAVKPDGIGKECYAFAVGQPSVTSSGMPVAVSDATNAVSGAAVSPTPASGAGSKPATDSIF